MAALTQSWTPIDSLVGIFLSAWQILSEPLSVPYIHFYYHAFF
jgi:hypothetical protein